MEKSNEQKQPKKWYKKWWGILIIIFFVMGVIGALTDDGSNTNTNSNQNSAEPAEEISTELNEQEKEQLLSFYNIIVNSPVEADKLYNEWSNELENKSVALAYLEIDNLIKANDNVRHTLLGLTVPNVNIFKEDKEKLEDAKNSIRTAYFTKNEALEQMKKYLNNNDLEALSKSKQDMEMYNSFLMEGIISLVYTLNKYNVELPE